MEEKGRAELSGPRCEAAFGQPGIKLIKNHSEDDDGADDDLAVVLIDAEDNDSAVDHLNDKGAEKGPER